MVFLSITLGIPLKEMLKRLDTEEINTYKAHYILHGGFGYMKEDMRAARVLNMMADYIAYHTGADTTDLDYLHVLDPSLKPKQSLWDKVKTIFGAA